MEEEKLHQDSIMLHHEQTATNACAELANNLAPPENGFDAVTDKMEKATENISINNMEANKLIIPVEIQLKIVKNIIDPKTLLSCRLVNWNWNSVANQKMAELNLTHWQTWLAEPENLEAPQKCRPSTILHHKRKQGKSYICVPTALKNSLQSWSTFTANSLTVYGSPKLKFWEKIFFRSGTKLDTFFVSFGSCLTTLTLIEVKVQCYYFHTILVNTPNLKAFTFERVLHLENKCHSTSCRQLGPQTGSFSKHLKYLRIYGECPEFWVQWILVLVGPQLVHLTLNGFSPALLLYCRKPFVNLKQLKINNPILEEFFVLVGPYFAPVLEYLVIRLDYNELPEYHDVASFITCRGTKLKHLCLNVELKELVKCIDKWRMRRVTFPKLTSLILQTSAEGENWKETSQTEDVLKTMPNIKTVNFITFPKSDQN